MGLGFCGTRTSTYTIYQLGSTQLPSKQMPPYQARIVVLSSSSVVGGSFLTVGTYQLQPGYSQYFTVQLEQNVVDVQSFQRRHFTSSAPELRFLFSVQVRRCILLHKWNKKLKNHFSKIFSTIYLPIFEFASCKHYKYFNKVIPYSISTTNLHIFQVEYLHFYFSIST